MNPGSSGLSCSNRFTEIENLLIQAIAALFLKCRFVFTLATILGECKK